jgi:predicted O-methyltransferase YrrM
MNSQDFTPGQLLEISGNYWKSCALHAGVKLDVFTALDGADPTGEEIAQELGADQRGLTMLLNTLTAMGLLLKRGDSYANTPSSAAFLSKKSPQYLGHMIMHHHNLMQSWSRLDCAVKTGAPVRKREARRDATHRESFLMGMFDMAMLIAPRLVQAIDLSGRSRLLDLGSGPGTYAIHFCLNNPQLKATVYDLPTTRPFAEKTIQEFGLSDRIDFVEGNYLDAGIEGRYDVAWLSHILHAEGPGNCQRIIEKTVAALEPGGMILVHEFILDNAMDGPLFPALFSLNMLLGTASGRAYSEKEIKDMLAQAGVRDIQRSAFRGPNDSGIIMGIVR